MTWLLRTCRGSVLYEEIATAIQKLDFIQLGKVMQELPPHVARLVRDKTLSTTEKAEERVEAALIAAKGNPPSISRSTHFLTNLFYAAAQRHGTAIFKTLLTSRRSSKKNQGIFSEWAVDGGHLVALTYFVRQFEVSLNQRAVVSRHALERVSQRLATLSPKDVRDELAAAVAACYNTHGIQNGEYLAATPHGYAVVVKENSGFRIPTWISEEMSRPEQSGGVWQRFTGISDRAGRVQLVTATGAPILALRKY